MPFESLQIIQPILRSLHEEGYRTPTPIQSQAIPIVLEGKDLLGVAQTGTGKTAAFSVPILQRLSEHRADARHEKRKHIRCLILTPTRELAVQIDQSIKAYGRHLYQTSVVIFGGVKQGAQTNALRRGVDIVVATPGRLLDLMDQGFVHLDRVEIFVLDEADRMLDMGFVRDVQDILKAIPNKRQSLFFSATMPPAIVKLAHDILDHPERVEVAPARATVDLIDQRVYYVDKSKKPSLLLGLLGNEEIRTALVFTRTKHGADSVVRTLERNRINAEAIHGNKSQNARQRALDHFKAQEIRVLVATDIAARGIDVDNLEWVINYEIPNVPETYVHRIGRTGRAGATGTAISLCGPDEKSYLREIEKLIKKKIPVAHDMPMPPIQHPMTQEPRERNERPRQHHRQQNASHKPHANKTGASERTPNFNSQQQRGNDQSNPQRHNRKRNEHPNNRSSSNSSLNSHSSANSRTHNSRASNGSRAHEGKTHQHDRPNVRSEESERKPSQQWPGNQPSKKKKTNHGWRRRR